MHVELVVRVSCRYPTNLQPSQRVFIHPDLFILTKYHIWLL